MSRPPFCPTKQIRSQPQNGVATPIPNRLGRDLKTRLRPQWPVSPLATPKIGRHPSHVVTSKPGRDPKQTRPGRDLKMGLRPHMVLTCNDLLFPCRNLGRSYPAQPGRDAKFKSRPKAAPLGFQPGRDLGSPYSSNPLSQPPHDQTRS